MESILNHTIDSVGLGEKLREVVTPVFDAWRPVPGGEHRSYGMDHCSKPDGSWVTEVDHLLDKSVRQMLADHWPDIPLLSEEQDRASQQALIDTLNRNSQFSCWVLDPLDGTSNFLHGIPVYGVSLALMQGRQAIIGVVYDPNRDELFTATSGAGAMCNGRAIVSASETVTARQAIAVVDYKRLSSTLNAHLVSKQPFYSQRNFGSVVLEWCWLACGRINAYIHGGQNIWDYAAGELIAREAGILVNELTTQNSEKAGDADDLKLQPVTSLAAETPELMAEMQTLLSLANTP